MRLAEPINAPSLPLAGFVRRRWIRAVAIAWSTRLKAPRWRWWRERGGVLRRKERADRRERGDCGWRERGVVCGSVQNLSRIYIREHTTRRYSCELANRHTIRVYMVPLKMGCVARISNSRNRCQNGINLRALYMLWGVVALITTTGTDYLQRPTHT